MSARLIASKLDRAAACPASFAMPAITLPPSEASARGTEIHRFLAAAVPTVARLRSRKCPKTPLGSYLRVNRYGPRDGRRGSCRVRGHVCLPATD